MTQEQIDALKIIVNGADIQSYSLARVLRSIEKSNPTYITICKNQGTYGPRDRHPYFGAIITKAGQQFLDSLA